MTDAYDIHYAPPERQYQDSLLTFKDWQMASTWGVRVENDPLGPVNKIVTLMRGQQRVKSVLWPVPDPSNVELMRDTGAWSIDEVSKLTHIFWNSRAAGEPPPEINVRVPGWRIEVDGTTVLTVTDAEMREPYTPPTIPLWRRMVSALRDQFQSDADSVAKRFGYHRSDDCGEWD